MEKVKISQDFLYQYLQEHGMNISLLGKYMGVSEGILRGSFNHSLNRHGKPMKFSDANIKRLNAAIAQVAAELPQMIVQFGSEQTFTNKRGTAYDPAAAVAIKKLKPYFKINQLTSRVLGWNQVKTRFTFSAPSSNIFEQITAGDVQRINAEILSVAGVLSNFEVVSDEKTVGS